MALLLVTHSLFPTTQHSSVPTAQSCPQWLLRHTFLPHCLCDHCWCQLCLHPSPSSALCSRHPPSSCHLASPPSATSPYGEEMKEGTSSIWCPSTWEKQNSPLPYDKSVPKVKAEMGDLESGEGKQLSSRPYILIPVQIAGNH